MKKVLTLALLMLVSSQAMAISEHYRQQLKDSGCTQMTDGNGCDIHKSKSENQAAAKRAATHAQTLDQISSEVESTIGNRLAIANEYLLNQGWRACGAQLERCKAGWKMRMVVDDAQDNTVVNAQIVGKE